MLSTLINSATENITALSSLFDAVFDIGPKIGCAITAIAAFIPPQEKGALFYWPYKVITILAWNFRHAANKSSSEGGE